MRIQSVDGHVFFVDNNWLDPKPSQEVHNHSPDGFSCGYWGSGPTQLALALLLLVFKPDTALKCKIDFRNDYVGKWSTDGPVDVDIDILDWYGGWDHERRREQEWR